MGSPAAKVLPRFPIPPEIVELTGITDDAAAGQNMARQPG
jgi:hypothetical protein